MSGYFERIEGHLMEAVERRAGRRAHRTAALGGRMSTVRRWLRSRRPGVLALAGVLILSGSATGAALLSVQQSKRLSGTVPPYHTKKNTISVAGSHYEIDLSPSLRAGTIGWCSLIFFYRAEELPSSGGCGTSTPAVGMPLFGAEIEPGPGLRYVLTAPQVASVHVAKGPTVLTRSEPGLPYGYRAAVFDVAGRDAAHGGPLHVTALDAEGRPIPTVSLSQSTPPEQTRYWSTPRRPAKGACSMTARDGSSVRITQGAVVTRLLADPGVIGHAFLSCEEVRLAMPHMHGLMLAALLLDAGHPGRHPAALPYTQPVPGAEGVYEGLSHPDYRSYSYVARRVGDTWLVVTRTTSEAQAIEALRALSAGPIDLSRPPGPIEETPNAECTIGMRRLAGAEEVSQTTFLVQAHGDRGGAGHSGRADGVVSRVPSGHELKLSKQQELSDTPRLTYCTRAEFYVDGWPLSATVMYPTGSRGTPKRLARSKPVPGHPGLFAVFSTWGERHRTAKRIGRTWLEIEGGSGPSQRQALLSSLHVQVAATRAAERGPLLPGIMLSPP